MIAHTNQLPKSCRGYIGTVQVMFVRRHWMGMKGASLCFAGDSQSVESGLWLYWCGRRVDTCWCYICPNVKHRIRWDKMLCSHNLPGTIANCFQSSLHVISMIARIVIIFLQNCLNEIYTEMLKCLSACLNSRAG